MKLRYTRRAARELADILAWIERSSPNDARRVRSCIWEVTRWVAQFSEAGRRTSNGRLRQVVVVPFPYIIFDEAAGEVVVIHGVRHTARDPASVPD